MSLGLSLATVCARSRTRRYVRTLRGFAFVALGALSLGFAQGQAVQHLFPTPVGLTDAPTQTVVLRASTPGTVAKVLVTTQGETGQDFSTASPGGDACTGHAVNPIAPCTVTVAFTPKAPGRRPGAVVLVDAGNNVLAEQLIDGIGTGPLAVIQPGHGDRVAGDGSSPFYVQGEDGPSDPATNTHLATSAHVDVPFGIAPAPAGDFYIADTSNNRIRYVDVNGHISTYAGTGSAGNLGDNGLAVNAAVNAPSQIVLDGAGNLYIADTGNSAIRRVDAVTKRISTVVGSSFAAGFSLDGTQGTAAMLSGPRGVALDVDGNLYIADTGNNVVRKVDAATGVINTVAGTGTAGFANDGQVGTTAQLNQPFGLAIGPDSALYIADSLNQAVRRLGSDGVLTTVAGMLNVASGSDASEGNDQGDGKLATQAKLNLPLSIALDAIGNLYIADTSDNRIRRVLASDKTISSIVNSGNAPVTTTNGTLLNGDTISLSTPDAIAMDAQNNLYIVDDFNKRILLIHGNQAQLRFPDMKVGKISATSQLLHIENDGTQPLQPTDLLFDQSVLALKADPNSPDCFADGTPATAVQLSTGQNCALGVEFAPENITKPDANGVLVDPEGTLTVQSNGTNTPDVVTMSATVLSVEPTKVTLTPNPTGNLGLGNSVTFTALVQETSGNAVPTGTVTFSDGTNMISGAVAMNGGVATFSTTTLTLGNHTITAKYSGDDNDAVSQASIPELVLQNTSVVVTSTLNPAPVNQNVTFTATVKPKNAGGTPITSGSVTFFDGATQLGPAANVNSNGQATVSTSTLTGGVHNITAQFAGDPSNLQSTSPAFQQTITKANSTTTVSAVPGAIIVGNSITLSATVVSNGGPVPTGTVTFHSGTTALGNAPLDPMGHASLPTTALVPTSATITATYNGDDFTNTSTSANPLTVPVAKLTTVTMLQSDGTPSNAGSPVKLIATVMMTPGQTAVGAISGTVTFFDGPNQVGSPATVNGGVATLSTTALGVGTHSLTATYNGNTDYDVSTSAPFSQKVLSSDSSTSLSLSTLSSIAGEPVTLTASVTVQGTVKPTGSVIFFDGTTQLGPAATLTPQGSATLRLTTLGTGPHTITASYSGDSNYGGSTSPGQTVTVRLGATTLTLIGQPTQAVFSTPIALTATLKTDGVLPSNPSVTLLDNGSPLTTQPVDGSGSIHFTAQNLAVGTHNLTAQYAGDGNNTAGQSIALVVTISAASTKTALSSNKASLLYGDSVTLQAVVTSNVSGVSSTVTFQEGATVLGASAVNGSGIATLTLNSLAVGQHSIVAVYAGDATHATSTSAPTVETVTLPVQVGLSSSANPAVASAPLTLTANVAGSAGTSGVTAHPGGTVTFRDGGTTLGTGTLNASGTATLTTSSLSVGTHGLTASYGGDANFEVATSAPLSQVVRDASSQTVLSTSGSPSRYTNAVTFTARVSGEGATPDGNVTFKDGAASLGQVTLVNGTATLTVSTLTPGIHAITASYAGNADNGASVSAAVSQQVIQPSQITLNSSSNPALTLETPVLTAVVKSAVQPFPTGVVRFLEGTRLVGTAALDAGGNASITAAAFSAGTHTLTAVYSGDAANDTVTSQPLTLVVNLRVTKTALTTTAAAQGADTFSLVAVVNGDGPQGPTGVVTFFAGGNPIGSSSVGSGGVATLNVSTTAFNGIKLTANYSGDNNYSPSTSDPIQLPTGNATDFTMTVTPTALNMPTKQYGATYVVIQSVGGFSDTLSLGCLGLPYAATCTFEKDSVLLPANGQVQVKLIVDTGSPLTAGGEAASNRIPGQKAAALAMLPLGALLLCFLRGRRKVPGLLVMLLLLAALLPTGGCGTLQQVSTPPGAYTIQVSASAHNGITMSQPVSVTVTK